MNIRARNLRSSETDATEDSFGADWRVPGARPTHASRRTVMAIASKVEHYLQQRGIPYDVIAHAHSHNSMESAQFAHVPGDCLAKSVVLEDDDGFVMAVLPSTCHVRLGQLSRDLNRHLRLATESSLTALFGDCDLGAIPPVGLAYGMPTVIDDSLAERPEIYFEAGDHEQLIRTSREAFLALMDHAGRARFAARM
jgi:Ala-tRNA(Pro) deacylase